MTKLQKPKAEESAAEKKVEKKAAKRVAPEKKPVVKKAAAAKVLKKAEEVYLQFGGEEWDLAPLKEKVLAAFVAEGHRASSAKKVALYIKPEERKVYYVINEKITGSVDF